MAVDVIRDAAALAALETDWRDLWQRTSDATPFQSPMWLLPWWRAFGSGDLHAVAVRADGQLTAFAPLMVLRDDDESLGMILGSGNSDYVDTLGPVDAIFAELANIDCQMWDFQQLRPSSAVRNATPPPGWTDSISDHDVCPRLTIEHAGDDLQNLVSPHFRQKLRYYRRTLERLGEVSVHVPDAANLDAFMDALFELHAARWQRRGLPGMLADEVDQRFQREAARALFDAGALRMYALRLNDRIVAVLYGFASHDNVYSYLTGYDPELEKLSIGKLIVAHAIQRAVADGARVFDFLRGAEQYKYAWGARDRVNQRRQLFRA